MKKALLYVLPLGYTALGTFAAWGAITLSSLIMSLGTGNVNKVALAALAVGCILSVVGLVALLIFNYRLMDHNTDPKLTVLIEALECALLFVPFMALWSLFFEDLSLYYPVGGLMG